MNVTWDIDIDKENEIILDILDEYSYLHYDESNLREVEAQQTREWMLVETNGNGEVWYTMHRSLDSVKWTVAESLWETLWTPQALYNIKTGKEHHVSIAVTVD